MSKTALIIVDVQHDFLPGGALGVPWGDQVIPVLREAAKEVELVVKSQDWHPENHKSFSINPAYQDGSWPAHCVQDTQGAALHPAINEIVPGRSDAEPLIVRKGTDPGKEAYSAFDGTKLAEVLKAREVTNLLVGGLALDYCVSATANDAVEQGWGSGYTTVLLNATKPVAWNNESYSLLQKLAWRGANLK